MNFFKRYKKEIITYGIAVILLVPLLYFIREVVQNYRKDNDKYYADPSLRFSISHFDEVRNAVRASVLLQVADYIIYCKRVPKNYEEIFNPLKSENLECLKRFEKWEREEAYLPRKGYRPWIDPWGRPYQIRYDREQKNMQLRSQGRYLWTTWDDVQSELWLDSSILKEQLVVCEEYPDDEFKCIFNRGWH